MQADYIPTTYQLASLSLKNTISRSGTASFQNCLEYVEKEPLKLYT